MTATLLPAILRPNAPAAYTALDHVRSHPELHDESVLIRHDGDRVLACYGTWTVLCAGYAVDDNGDIKLADLPRELADEIRYVLHDDEDADPEYPRLLADVSEVAQVLLRISPAQVEEVFGPDAGRRALRRRVERIFGPRPLGDDGALEMTDAEVAAELAIDRSGTRVHWATPLGGLACGGDGPRRTQDPGAITCPKCLLVERAGTRRPLAAVYEIGEVAP
jgi:hypothetical protein